MATKRILPWPVRCYARDGKVRIPGMGPYSANLVEPMMLFDELMRLNQGDVAGYRRTREAAFAWLEKYPMKNNVWVGYFEDVNPSMGNMNQVIPLEYARYILLNPDKDPNWKKTPANLSNGSKPLRAGRSMKSKVRSSPRNKGTARHFAAQIPISAAIATHRALPPPKLSISPKPATPPIAIPPSAPSIGSLTFKACPKTPTRPSAINGGSLTNSPTAPAA